MTIEQSYTPPQPLSPADERLWAMLAHLGVLANLVTGFLGTLVPLVIYLVYKDRSRYVAFQSMQAFVFQLIWWVGGGILARRGLGAKFVHKIRCLEPDGLLRKAGLFIFYLNRFATNSTITRKSD